jgi:hypothetical protein
MPKGRQHNGLRSGTMSQGHASRRGGVVVTIECPYCNLPFRTYEDDESVYCPSCDQRVRIENGQAAPVGSCSVHPEAAALGSCRRCGNFLCLTCRTRWYGRYYCVECVEFLTAEKLAEMAANVRGHRWAAWLAVIFGLVGWLSATPFLVLVLLASYIAQAFGAGRSGELFPLASIAAQGAGLGALGLGQAIAAIRTRGDHMILATVGLFISGLLVSVTLGILLAACVRVY